MRAVDLGINGLRIESPPALAAGDVLSLTLDPGACDVRLTAIVLSLRPSDGHTHRREAHLAFTNMSEAVRANLGRLIARCVDEQLAAMAVSEEKDPELPSL